jgi:hypothetical protein
MGVRVAFLEEGAANAADAAPRGVLVPSAAIVRRGGREVVYVADGEVARERAVSIGDVTVGNGRQVLDGVRAGERVVLDPPEVLTDGAAIRERRGP